MRDLTCWNSGGVSGGGDLDKYPSIIFGAGTNYVFVPPYCLEYLHFDAQILPSS